MLKNVKKENIRPASIDLQLEKAYKISKVKLVDFEKNVLPKAQEIKLPFILKPGEYILASTIEEINQEKKKYACLVSPRSRAFRVGLAVQGGFFDPYYVGKITFGIKNISNNSIKIYKGMSLIQISFMDIKGETVPVKHDFQFGKIL